MLLLTIIQILIVLLNVVWWIIVLQVVLSWLIAFNVINTGSDGMQEVMHLHLHVMGGPRPWSKG